LFYSNEQSVFENKVFPFLIHSWEGAIPPHSWVTH